jgi:hypothetical protein
MDVLSSISLRSNPRAAAQGVGSIVVTDAMCCLPYQPREKPYKFIDGGLFRLIERSGSRLWRQAYRFQGKRTLIALGSCPAVSLAGARTERDAQRALQAPTLSAL